MESPGRDPFLGGVGPGARAIGHQTGIRKGLISLGILGPVRRVCAARGRAGEDLGRDDRRPAAEDLAADGAGVESEDVAHGLEGARPAPVRTGKPVADLSPDLGFRRCTEIGQRLDEDRDAQPLVGRPGRKTRRCSF
jgi:hypothetical protein